MENLNKEQKQHNLIDDELEVGKFYRTVGNDKSLFFITCTDVDNEVYNAYGFMDNGDWSNLIALEFNEVNELEIASEMYAIKLLKWYAENVMKYNHEEPNYKCLYGGEEFTNSINPKNYSIRNNNFFVSDGFGENCLMADGDWTKPI